MSKPKPNPLQKAVRGFLRDLIAPAPKPKKKRGKTVNRSPRNTPTLYKGEN